MLSSARICALLRSRCGRLAALPTSEWIRNVDVADAIMQSMPIRGREPLHQGAIAGEHFEHVESDAHTFEQSRVGGCGVGGMGHDVVRGR